MVTSLSPVVFLMTCWVIVEPPRVDMPVSLPRMAFAVLFQSTPWWLSKRSSSMEMSASRTCLGISSILTSVRFSTPWSFVSSTHSPLALS